MLVSELNMLVGFPLQHLSNEMTAKWDALEKAQTAVIRDAHFLLNRCHLVQKENNTAAEQSKSLIKAVSKRDHALQVLLDTGIKREKSENDTLLMKVIRKGRAVVFQKSRRRFEVQKKQCVWEVSLCAARAACLPCQ